jgi:hypothetical protein
MRQVWPPHSTLLIVSLIQQAFLWSLQKSIYQPICAQQSAWMRSGTAGLKQ